MAVRKELSSLLIISCFLATTGYCYQQQQEDQTFSTEELCRQSLLNTTLHTAITAARSQSSPYPCTQNVMELDVTFRFQKGCYVQMFYENGVKQKCCYDNYGNLMVGAPNGGYITVEQFEQDIEMVKHACCQDSQTCDDFYSFNPSDDCSTFKVLHPAKSWGDPEITTVDHHTFSFNGHGEYVYLLLNDKEWEMEIQARTDYLEKGNVDATIFVAFVIHAHVSTKNKSDIVHVHLDTNNSSVAVYLKNDSRFNPREAPLMSSLFYIFYTNKSSVLINSKTGDASIEVSNLKNLGLSISVVTSLNGSGLAGSTKNEKFVCKNNTAYSLNASEAELFNYGESWSVRNVNESKFHYNITLDRGNFTFYNRSHTKPRFLESLVNNLTELFDGWSGANITNFTETCHMEWNKLVSNACLLAIARSKKLETGQEVIDELRRQHDLKRRAENEPPAFQPDMVTHVLVNYSDVGPFAIDLSEYVEDANNDTLSFGVVTNIKTSTYTINDTTGLFTWDVGGQARWEEVSLTFLVKDNYSQSPFSLFISYCGCQKEGQCDFTFLEPLNSTGKFERYGCSCTGLYTSGRFCESRINPCDNIDCSSGDLNLGCDNSSDADNPCEPCPSGYQTSFVTIPTRQQNCTNIDECKEESPCAHQCNDTDGGYICSCYEGFALNSKNNSTCIDIDECKEGKKVCKLNEVCYDPQGNATCICIPGFSRSSDKDKCKKTDGFLYTFTMALVVTDPGPLPPPKTNDAKEMLWKALNNSMNFTDVIINRVFYGKIPNRSRKRRDIGLNHLNIDYTVLMEKSTTYTVLQSNLTTLLKGADSLQLGNIDVVFDSIKMAGGGSCSLGDDCDKATSHCVDNNGTLSCECNDGFKEVKKGLKYCQDIDECTEVKNLTERCFGGTCSNKFDGWNCTCPSNTTWAKIGHDVYPYFYRCQGNHSYIGNISLYRHGNNKYKQDDFTSFLQELFKVWFDNETVISGHTPSLKDLFVKTSVFHLIVKQERYHGKPSGYWYNCSFILTLGDAVNTSRLDSVLQTGKEYELKPDNCTTEGDDCKVFYVNLYYDSDDILCNLGNKCDMYTTTCNASYGVYRCECKQGFARFDNYNCRDIDECEEPVSHKSCSLNNGTCHNLFGDWSCTCQDGYNTTNYSFDNRTCEDVDECSTLHPCQGNHDCSNTEGSWKCTCKEGYNETSINSTHTECADIDECLGEYCNGTCYNTDGSFTCQCPDGFNATAFENRSIACIDRDECKKTDQCKNGNCSNTVGNFTCSCPKDLDQPVTNSQNITICSGSNLYRFTETITFSRRLSEAELQIAVTELEEEIQRRYNSEFSEIKVTVIVTITKFNRTRRESTNSTKYHMTTKIISSVQRPLKEFQGVLANISVKEINRVNASLIRHPESLVSVTGTTTPGITTTPACDKEKCRCLGEEICEPKRLKTILSASAGSLGGVVAILVITIVIICRKRKNDAKRVQEKEDNISLNTIGNNFSNRVRTHDNRTSNVDGASRSSSFSSNKFGPGFIPRITLLAGSEPRPDYDPQPVFEKPTFQRPGSMNMDYNRHSSPYYDLRGQQFLRNSGGSHNSGMDASRNSMNYFGHKMPVFNPLYAEVKRKA